MEKLNEKQIDFLNKYTIGTWELNSSTGLIDVEGNVDCSEEDLTDFSGIQFGVITGCFHCYDNQLTSLGGSPRKVGRGFDCSFNELETLKGSPNEVGGNFNCSYNKLSTLKGSPLEVQGDFICYFNKLISLEGAPKKIGGHFDCSYNEILSLKGAPIEVQGDFICCYNEIISLYNAPQMLVVGNFIYHNNKIYSIDILNAKQIRVLGIIV